MEILGLLFGAFVIFIGIIVLALMTGMIRYIPNNRIGMVEKLFGTKALEHGLIALDGETGFQPEVLRGGWHFFMPFQYRIHSMPLVTIPQGKIGYIFARDGAPLSATQALASNVNAKDFQDVRGFLNAGGQQGPQRMVLREGTYAINLVQFVVISDEQVYYHQLNANDEEVFNRMALLIRERNGFYPIIIKGTDEIIASIVGADTNHPESFHNNFQDPEKFLKAGGKRGRQLQVLVEGTYYINRLFATVEMIPKTVVDVGYVGVVVSYTGDIGNDLSGSEYKHGEMVTRGSKGVWSTALLPGKYAFNTYAGKIIMVPTTNIILKWISSEAGSHKLDENLAEISLITKDAFEPTLPLSVVIHIDYRNAPLVIQRFGDIKRLVEQSLDPMVSAYFKNIGQTRTLIQLLQDRSLIQQTALEEMRERFSHYNLELEEVLIGTPGAGTGQQIETILNQLRSRQIAEEQIETYSRQEKAAVQERQLREAESRAKQQASLTESEISITIQSNQGKADYARAQQEAVKIKTLAEAEAQKIRIVAAGESQKIKFIADADAERAAKVGIANALAVEEQVQAYGGPQFQLVQQVMQRFTDAIESSKVDVVPKILMMNGNSGEGGSGGGGSILESLLGIILSEKMNGMLDTVSTQKDRGVVDENSPAARIKRDLMTRLEEKPPEEPPAK
ncbi:MAG: flotillin family protein [Cyanobacteria bacterium]|nr:flotillin family protein [Cyanobacteriota bacterium]